MASPALACILRAQGLNAIGGGGLSPAFSANLKTSIIPQIGTLSTFSRASTATIVDNQGLVRNTLANEARFYGARRVENLFNINNITDSANFTVEKGYADPLGGTDAIRLTVTSNSASTFYFMYGTALIGKEVRGSMYIRRVTGTGSMSLLNGSDSVSRTELKNMLTSAWQRFATPAGIIGQDNSSFGIRNLFAGTVGDQIEIAFGQFEDVTGQINKNPSEVVTKGIGTKPDFIVDGKVNPTNWRNGFGSSTLASADMDSNGISLKLLNGTQLIKSAATSNGNNYTYSLNTGIDEIVYGRLVAITLRFSVVGLFGRSDVNANISVYFNYNWLGEYFRLGAGAFNGLKDGTYEITQVKTLTKDTTPHIDTLFLDASLLGISSTLPCELNIFDVTAKEIEHGSNADGVKYFDTLNGNTVLNGVVTDATGAAIPEATLKGYLAENSSTNLFLNSELPVTQTIDLTAQGVGDYTVSLIGNGSCTSSAGTAVGTGFAIATSASATTFNLTVAGTVVFTITGADATTKLQVEKNVAPTSYIPTAGAAVTRDRDLLQYDIGAVDGTKGAAVAEVFPLAASLPPSSHRGILNLGVFGRGLLNFANNSSSLISFDGTTQSSMTSGVFPSLNIATKVGVTWGSSGIMNLFEDSVLGNGPATFDGDYNTSIITVGAHPANGTFNLNSPVKNILIYKKELTATKMIGLTT